MYHILALPWPIYIEYLNPYSPSWFMHDNDTGEGQDNSVEG